jgi:hypothetical protein
LIFRKLVHHSYHLCKTVRAINSLQLTSGLRASSFDYRTLKGKETSITGVAPQREDD